MSAVIRFLAFCLNKIVNASSISIFSVLTVWYRHSMDSAPEKDKSTSLCYEFSPAYVTDQRTLQFNIYDDTDTLMTNINVRKNKVFAPHRMEKECLSLFSPASI